MNKQVWNQGTLYTYTINKESNTIIIENSKTRKAVELTLTKSIQYGDDVRDLIDNNNL